MPELPDLEVVKEYLQRRLPGQRIETVEVLRPIVMRNLTDQDADAALADRGFLEVSRRGKFLVLALEDGLKLVVTPMLAGRLQYCRRSERHRARTYVVLQLSSGMDIRYVDDKAMGKVYLTREAGMVPGFEGQGPEALDPELTLEVFEERLRRRRGELKGILTNQGFLAGIGNAYADEILFRAGLYPFRKRPSLSPAELGRLHRAIPAVLCEAVSVLRERMGHDIDEEVRDFLQVHGKGGAPCPRCGTVISQVRARGRLTNFCRACQPGRMVRG